MICDFGFAIKKSDPYFKEFKIVGTTDYYPWEMVTRQKYDERVDIWCIGVILFEMIFGKTPFENKDKEVTK